MVARRPTAVLLAAAALTAPVPLAHAQDQAAPDISSLPSLGEDPPPGAVAPSRPARPQPARRDGDRPRRPAAAPARATLPDTGADPWVLALAGASLVLAGVGLRLRVRDVRF